MRSLWIHQPLEYFEQALATSCVGYGEVEVPVGLEVRVHTFRSAIRVRAGRAQGVQPSELCGIDPTSGQLGRRRLDDQSQPEQLVDVTKRDRRNRIAVPRDVLDPPLLNQPGQCLADRRLAEPALSDELRFGEQEVRRHFAANV
jgi:hypothetical protein